jgi:ATP-binding cassette, subfamily B, bacterial MsbA
MSKTSKTAPKSKSSGLMATLRSYRLVRYAKPYKKFVALMYVLILLYAGCHGVQALIIRDLLEEGMWLPPEPPLKTGIEDVVRDAIPAENQDAALTIARAAFEDAVKSGLTEHEYKKVEEEPLEKARERLASGAEVSGELHTLLAVLGEKGVPGAKRRVFLAMGERIAAGLDGKVPQPTLDRFSTAVGREFQRTSNVDSGRLRILCLELAGVAVVVALVVLLRIKVRARIVTGAIKDVRRDLCDHLMSLDMKFFGGKSSGEMISRQTNDVAVGMQALALLFGELSVQPFLAIAYLAIAFYLSWQLLVVFLVMLLVLVFPVAKISKRIRKYGRQGLERIADLTGAMSEIFQGMRVIKAFGAEQKKHREFQEMNDRHIRRTYKIMTLKGRTRAVTEGFVNICIAIVMFAASYLVTDGIWGIRLSPPDVMAFAACMLMLYRPIRALAKTYPKFMEHVAASERVFEVLDREPDVQDAPGAVALAPISESMSFRNVSFAYDEPLVLDDVTFSVKRGEVVAIVGRSGAGKSTLLDLIPRFYDPTSGSIEIDGVDIRRGTLESLRQQIAIVSQEPFLFRSSIRENINLARPDATGEDIVRAAQAANIHEFIESLPDGYDTICGERGVRLSGGQRQRITIARAVLKDAPILILDEATSSLDAESQRLVRDALHQLMEHRTTFVIAHRLSTVQGADKLIVLRDGRLVETGTHAELIEKQGEYWQLHRTEFDSNDAAE